MTLRDQTIMTTKIEKQEKSLFEMVNNMMDDVYRVKALQDGKRDLFEQCYGFVCMDLMIKGIKIN